MLSNVVRPLLLIDTAYALQSTYVERILTAEITWVSSLDLSVSGIIILLSFQGYDLSFSQYLACCRNIFFKGYKPFFKGLKITSQPDRSHARGRYKDASLTQLI